METKIIEGNKLIAEFMGWGNYNDRAFNTPYEDADWCNGERTSICDDSRLKFHSSWDWLMPVVDKIQDSKEYEDYLSTLNLTFGGGIEINTKYIEVTFNAVVEFIKWYNQQSK